MRRGFTLIELAFVLGIIAVLAAITVPGYQAIVLRARADEARTMLQAIAHAELRHHRDTGAFLACPSSGDVPRGPSTFPATATCWKSLGLVAEGPVRFRYSVVLDEHGFTAVAEGDLDADGTTSHYALAGKTLALTVRDALE